MPQPIVKIKDLDIIYNQGKENEYHAIHKVSMEIYPEEFVAFFGPSGCGKSTLFYSILGILAPASGTLLVKGENPYSFSPEKMVKFQTSTIGIIYQAFYLITSISVIDNVALPQIFHSVEPGKRERWAKDILKRFGMDMHAEKYPDNLSGGQSQRVSVSRSMVNNPDILLADEPTGNLDSVSTKQVMDSLEEINQKDKKTVIMITHNAAQLQYCHRVFYMKDGRLLRIVPNPEKKQIAKVDKQKMIVTEMDQLSKIHPYLTPIDLKVKSIVNFVTQKLSFDQIVRMEDTVKSVIERTMSFEKLEQIFAERYEKGGIGLGARRAKQMTEEIQVLLKQSEDVGRYRRRLDQNVFYGREQVLIKRLAGYLIKIYGGKITPVQIRRLRETVYHRISGITRKESFLRQLSASLEKGGVGLNRITAENMTYYFEKLLAQGVKVEGHH